MALGVRQIVSRNLYNLPGWRTNRKIVVIESDDWGSIRIPSKRAFDAFVAKSFRLEKSTYNRYDALECDMDLIHLFETLRSCTDANGNPAVVTANCILANPDFQMIRRNDFQQYHYELVTETLRRYPQHCNLFRLWKEGYDHAIFMPQFHGREHLNVFRWMERLKRQDEKILFSFEHQTTFSGEGDYSFMEAFDADSWAQTERINAIVVDGLRLFEKLFGYRSKSIIAPCYTWHSSLEPVIMQMGVKYLQGSIYQLQPILDKTGYQRRFHYMGQRNKLGQCYIVRNCTFEPTLNPKIDSVATCLKQIEIAFNWHKPAVISCHRINFAGYVEEKNRTKNILLFKTLLTEIMRRWPDAEFMASDQLGDLMVSS